jgi:DNA mismatch endonuclease, patch repair protein
VLDTDDATRARMRAQRTRDTAPELAVRAALRAAGLTGYRVDHRLPVPRRRADVSWPGRRVAVFVDGCFWHGCPEHSRPVTRNGDWWAAKRAGNAARDRATDEALEALGWAVVRAWEHEDPAAVAERVGNLLARMDGGTDARHRDPRRARSPRPQPKEDTMQDPESVETDVPAAAENVAERVTLAMAEQKAVKAWQKEGGTDPRPATPNMDAIQEEHDMGTKRKSGKASGPARVPQDVVFTVDGQPQTMKDRKYTLGYAAFRHTAGIGGQAVKRITTGDLRALLAKAGVADPDHATGWTATLPNGVVLGAVTAAEAAKMPSVPRPRKAAAAKKAPAAKKATRTLASVKKAPAKKAAPAKRQATPIPKGSTRKPGAGRQVRKAS